MISISAAQDSGGLGAMFQGLANATGTDECGSKPTCISLSKNSNCAQKNKAYNECRMKALDVNSAIANNQTRSAEASNQNKTKIIIAFVVVVIVLAFILKRR